MLRSRTPPASLRGPWARADASPRLSGRTPARWRERAEPSWRYEAPASPQVPTGLRGPCACAIRIRLGHVVWPRYRADCCRSTEDEARAQPNDHGRAEAALGQATADSGALSDDNKGHARGYPQAQFAVRGSHISAIIEPGEDLPSRRPGDRLVVFARGTDNNIWHAGRSPATATGRGGESIGAPPGGQPATPDAAASMSGRRPLSLSPHALRDGRTADLACG
jgi:hypothetical protein